MEQFGQLKRRGTNLLKDAQQKMPAMPTQMPKMPSMPKIPTWSTAEDEFQPNARIVPKGTTKGTWERIYVPDIPRSSHTINIVSSTAYIFGGEVNPREPVDNDMHVIRLPYSDGGVSADCFRIKAVADIPEEPRNEPASATSTEYKGASAAAPGEEEKDKPLDEVSLETKDKGKGLALDIKPELDDVPAPRIGHASAVIGSRIFIFGGRGADNKPIDEAGRIWVFDTRSRAWSYLDPSPAVQGGAIVHRPSPRSYHTATATDRPRDFAKPRSGKPQTWQEWAVGDSKRTGIPQAPIVGNVAEEAVDEETAGYGTFFVHAGCLEDGERANDLWAFDIRTRTWSQLPAAPGKPRGGTSICISKSRLFRFGGFDGETEIGGSIDFLDLEVETFNDRGSRGEVAVRAHGPWQTILQNNPEQSSPEIPTESAQAWPSPRSVTSLEAITLGGGREYLLLTMGEVGPSGDGHNSAGSFSSEVWLFQVPPLGMTTASVTDAFWQLTGRKTGEGHWSKVFTMPHDDELSDEEPVGRGWMASAVMADLEDGAIVVWGGVDERNERLGDGWILRVGN